MTATWTIAQLERQIANGFVTTAHWRAIAEDGNFSATVYGSCGWPVDAPIVAWENLTQDVVLAWVWESIDKAEMETLLQKQIDTQKTPTTSNGVPWA